MVKFRAWWKRRRTWWERQVEREKRNLIFTVVALAITSLFFNIVANSMTEFYKTRADEKDKELLALVIVFRENLLYSENGNEEILERLDDVNQKSSEYKSKAFSLETSGGILQITFQSSLLALILILFENSVKKYEIKLRPVIRVSLIFSLFMAFSTLILALSSLIIHR